MMMGLLNQYTAWILDKTEGNPMKRPDGKPYWGSFVDLTTNQVTPTATFTNAFCAGGTTLGNGTWLVAGGNQPVDEGGAPTYIYQPSGVYQDQDGRKAIRIIEPNNYRANDSRLAWLDNYSANTPPLTGNGLQMQSWRWYPGVEPLADGTVVLIGGANNGGYINRNTPNTDPAFAYPTTGGPGNLDNNGLFYGGANPTYEFWPSQGTLRIVNFMVKTSGLNMYPHTFLMPDGRIFMQANYSTTLWDPRSNTEEALPDMPDQIIRVYPASGATWMLPLTPENDYTPTIVFCGGTVLADDAWGNYTAPNVNVLNVDASRDCSSITPVDSNGNTNANAQYVREEKMPEGRTMGNAIHLPDGTTVILNGAEKGTAGYANVSWNIVNAGQPNEVRTEGLAQNPAYKPLIYDPSKPQGQRLSNKGLGFSDHERLYHSSAILAPDGSVLIAGSNPHQDVALNMTLGVQPQAYNTSYVIEKWYPPWYFDTRPQPDQLPDTLPYGGRSFTVKIGADYMGQYSNWRAGDQVPRDSDWVLDACDEHGPAFARAAVDVYGPGRRQCDVHGQPDAAEPESVRPGPRAALRRRERHPVLRQIGPGRLAVAQLPADGALCVPEQHGTLPARGGDEQLDVQRDPARGQRRRWVFARQDCDHRRGGGCGDLAPPPGLLLLHASAAARECRWLWRRWRW